MKPLVLISFLFTIFTFTASAQLYKYHDWSKTPAFVELSEEESKLPSVAIKEKYLIQYYTATLGNKIRLFETKHNIIRINTDKGIKKHNRVYIPTRNVVKVVDIKARVIQKDGSVKYLDKNNIKELKNVKDYGNFKIFAIEGVTTASQLEYIYTLERNASSLGAVVVQKDYKVKEAEVIIRKPPSRSYRLKPYNGFPDMSFKKVDGGKEALTATIKNIEAMTEEASASPQANRMKVSYQVIGSYVDDYAMWSNLESNIKNTYVVINPSKFKPLIKDYTKYIENKPRETNIQIINNICEYVYGNYNIKRSGENYNLSNLKYIIKSKQATEQGIIKLFSCLFNHENLDYEIVLTSDRNNHKFDADFFSNSNLQIALFYFIEEQKYLRPTYFDSRLNFAPSSTISNNAIFINAKGRRFKIIDVPDASENVVQRDFLITLDTESALPTVQCNHLTTGYRGTNSRGAYKYLKHKDLNEFKNFTAANGIEDAEFLDFKVADEALSLSSENIPFKLNYTYTAESLVEDLGERFILNFGKVIGTQNEFYQEAKRVNPIELSDLITYQYEIKIKIPEGYQAKNVEDAAIDKAVHIEDKLACSFVSHSKIEDGFVIINATEVYNKIYMDIEHYEAYKDVINAAFDFSKKSILFKKI